MTLRHTVRLIAVPVLLAAVLSGCTAKQEGPKVAAAGGQPSASAAPATAQDAAAQGRAFAKCMREQGIDMPDPGPDGMAPPLTIDKANQAKLTAASSVCREFLPNGGEPTKMSAADIAKRRDFAKCVRENGLPEFPDPDPETGDFSVGQGKANIIDKLGAVAPKCPQFGGAMPTIRIDG